MDNQERYRINIDVNPSLWRAVGVTAAKLGITKRQLLKHALLAYIQQHDKTTYQEMLDHR